MLELSREKIELTAGMMLGGRKPATTTATNPEMSAYSIRSWPLSSDHNRRIVLKRVFSIGIGELLLSAEPRNALPCYLSILRERSGQNNRQLTVSLV
jgi:hypothetical protein